MSWRLKTWLVRAWTNDLVDIGTFCEESQGWATDRLDDDGRDCPLTPERAERLTSQRKLDRVRSVRGLGGERITVYRIGLSVDHFRLIQTPRAYWFEVCDEPAVQPAAMQEGQP